MGKRRVKQQNISVIGLFKLAGRHKKMDDVFVNTRKHTLESLSQNRKKQNKTKQTTNKHTSSIPNKICHVSFTLFVCLCAIFILSSCSFVCYLFFTFFSRVLISYTFYLVVVVHFNCIKRPVFKGPEFPCIQYKHCDRYLYQLATSLQPMAGFLCYFYLCELAATRKCKNYHRMRNEIFRPDELQGSQSPFVRPPGWRIALNHNSAFILPLPVHKLY